LASRPGTCSLIRQVSRAVHTRRPVASVMTISYVASVWPPCARVATAVTSPWPSRPSQKWHPNLRIRTHIYLAGRKLGPAVTANGGPYFGELIGRYGNRIAKGTFSLNQPGVGKVTYTVPVNNGLNSLHGGLIGFGNHVWADQPVYRPGAVGVQLTLVSPNRDQSYPAGSPGCPNGCTGYPATIKVVVTYTLNNANQLEIHYKTTDLSKNLNTVINLTNHSYFNLAGESSFPGSAYGQLIRINANRYTPTSPNQPNFPSTELFAGQTVQSTTIFAFSS